MDIPQNPKHGAVEDICEADDVVESLEGHVRDNPAGDDRPEGVCETVGNVRDGVDRAVDTHMPGVHQVAQHGEQ